MTREEENLRAWSEFIARLRAGDTVLKAMAHLRFIGIFGAPYSYCWRRIRAAVLYAEGTR